MDGFDAALARYRAFLAAEPITPLLRRSLALLVPGNIRVDTVTADDRLRCTTDGTAVTVGGAEYLLRTDFDARHWTAALRVLLAREIQHDSSSDRDVCAAFAAEAGAYFHAHYALAPETGALLGHRILNILEQARTDNILCRRFPGYLPLLRFVCYAQLDAAAPGGGRLPPAFAERAKALHHRLDKLLRQQRERSASQRTGALSQRELWKIPLDAKDVFRRKAPPSRRETAFYLLIDRSGSMGAGVGGGQSKLFTALATAAVLEEALKGIAYTKIVAFDGGTNAVEHCVIKDFDQKEIGSRCIDAMEQIAAGNGNKDGYSIRAAALDLAKRTERRKILMVLSDGLPSGYFSEAEAIDDVRTAVQAVRRRGLLVIPIIYTARTDENVDAYRRMYEKSMIFADSVGMLGEFERLLMKLVR